MLELAHATGADGREYRVVTTKWDLDKIESYWEKIAKFPIFSDDLDKTPQGFLKFVLTAGAIWFEIVDIEKDEVMGLMYLTEMTQSTTGRMVEATWHAMLWDAKAGVRRPVLRAAIKALFNQLGFHRIRVEIPLHFGGVIRQAKKIGFLEEGRIREAKQYNGIWYDCLLLSVLEREVVEWVA